MAETDPSSTHDDPIAELTSGFAESARILFSTGTVSDTLQRVVELAASTIEGCDFAGIFLLEGDVITTPAYTDMIVIKVDSLQHHYQQGPCLDVITGGATMTADDLIDDSRWPQFGPEATSAGIRSAMALSLSAIGTHGALNLYARHPHAFGVTDRAQGLLLSGLAGQALSTAQAHDEETQRFENLQAALVSRAVIGQAQGILMERERLRADQAFDILHQASQHLNMKLRDVAQALVDTGQTPQTGHSLHRADEGEPELPGKKTLRSRWTNRRPARP